MMELLSDDDLNVLIVIFCHSYLSRISILLFYCL